jgi:3-deoxy-7-phosphoheptulonate synthase
MKSTSDVRVQSIRPLLSPAILREEIPISAEVETIVARGRREVSDALHGRDDRLIVLVGPCSIHDTAAGLEYAARLSRLAREVESTLCVVMRVYFEKPRTTVGWKGLINDPFLDDTHQINEGLRRARGFLRDVSALGLPCGTEFLDPITPQFTADLVSWGAIGARTTESQVHRQLASGLSMPIGFKNGTQGTVQIAVDAVVSARSPHRFVGVTEQGLAAIVQTTGNSDCHVILRGGARPNYDTGSVAVTAELLAKANAIPRVMIDASHGNSEKNHLKQKDVAADVALQISRGSRSVFGVMLESFLVGGRQDLKARAELVYGQSITDACLSFTDTEDVLRRLAASVKERRTARDRPTSAQEGLPA